VSDAFHRERLSVSGGGEHDTEDQTGHQNSCPRFSGSMSENSWFSPAIAQMKW
jgi:hypothetical protein